MFCHAVQVPWAEPQDQGTRFCVFARGKATGQLGLSKRRLVALMLWCSKGAGEFFRASRRREEGRGLSGPPRLGQLSWAQMGRAFPEVYPGSVLL
jgi:hypothetical protein